MICDACQEQIDKWRDWQEPYRGWRVVAYTPSGTFSSRWSNTEPGQKNDES